MFKLGPLQEKWMQSLEQHPERQGHFSLGSRIIGETNSYQACCLGEGGLIAGVCEWRGNRLVVVNGGSSISLDGIYESLGLRGGIGYALDDNYPSMMAMNDGMGDEQTQKTWPEIAAFVRANAEQYFTHPV